MHQKEEHCEIYEARKVFLGKINVVLPKYLERENVITGSWNRRA